MLIAWSSVSWYSWTYDRKFSHHWTTDDSPLYGARWTVTRGGTWGRPAAGIPDVAGGAGALGAGGLRVGVPGMGLDGWVLWGEVDSCGILCCDGNWGGGCVLCGDGDWGGAVAVFTAAASIALVCTPSGAWFWGFILGSVGFSTSNVASLLLLDYGELAYISARGLKVLVHLMEKEDKSQN